MGEKRHGSLASCVNRSRSNKVLFGIKTQVRILFSVLSTLRLKCYVPVHYSLLTPGPFQRHVTNTEWMIPQSECVTKKPTDLIRRVQLSYFAALWFSYWDWGRLFTKIFHKTQQ